MALSRWGFPNDVGLITRTDQLMQMMTKTVVVDTTSIENVINEAIETVDDSINEKIDESTNAIIEAMPECKGGCDHEIDCCTATKCDIRQAVDEIKTHIDNAFNGETESVLFEEISDIYNKLKND